MPAPAQHETGMLDAYLERQTSRLTVTENYIWTILAVTWVVVPILWILLVLYAASGKTALLAPRSTDKKVKFRDRKISTLIQTYGKSGALSFDNIMQIRFTRAVRNILSPGALVASIALLIIYNSAIMNKSSAEVVSMMADVGSDALSTLAGTSKSGSGNDRNQRPGTLAPLTQLTIEYCSEETLKYPIAFALAINAFAHAMLVLYSRRLVTYRTKWLDGHSPAIHMRTLLLYRLRGNRKFLLGNEKFHDEAKLKETIETLTGGSATVQYVTEGQDLRRNYADILISSVRKHNEAIWEIERIILRRQRASDHGKLDQEKEAKLVKAFQKQLRTISRSKQRYYDKKAKFNKNKAEGKIVPANHLFVTFPSTYQACVAYKALQNEKSLNIGTKEDYDPRKHLTFASPEKDFVSKS
ncbi:hypothetical protein NCC49_003973 [Naganishia albida]|nr:hypothetical protein NCC49_003973 [Naganishia albida]